jgi:DMSO/TMAO reductase YedYZ heme-binding membrane subunit
MTDANNSGAESTTTRAVPLKKISHWRSLFIFSIIAIAFWILQFVLQFYWLTRGEIAGSLVRSFALAGATLIAFALFLSVVFKLRPKMARYWRVRRYLGVWGFLFSAAHGFVVAQSYFDFDLSAIYYSYNPLENPIVFGSIAFYIFAAMAITSSDWAVQKLTPRWWKFLHRFVYVAFLSAVYHFITINPALLNNPAGYLLLTTAGVTILGHLYLFFKLAIKKQFKSVGSMVGLVIIVGGLIVGYMVYRNTFVPLLAERNLNKSIELMNAYMGVNPVDSDLKTEPILEDKSFSAVVLERGEFNNINYMTSGVATLEKAGEVYYIVFGEEFVTPNGPDLQVYLTKNIFPTSRENIQEGIHLGKLKSTKGKQVFAVSSDVDIKDFNSVSIHCKAFNVPWSYAAFE